MPDALADPRFAASPLVLGPPFIRSYAGVPLRTPDGYNVGALCAIDTKARDFSPSELLILSNFASIVSDELELRLIAQRDHLTGTLTRRGFMEHAEREIAKCSRYDRPGALAIFDVDHFKAVNDTYGHPAGDRVLRQIADVCTANMRPSDVLGRIGGEEFAMLLPESGAAEAIAAVERFRSLIEAQLFDIGEGRTLKITASFGVAAYEAGLASVADWMAVADLFLYRAKAEGRNRCCLAVSAADANAV